MQLSDINSKSHGEKVSGILITVWLASSSVLHQYHNNTNLFALKVSTDPLAENYKHMITLTKKWSLYCAKLPKCIIYCTVKFHTKIQPSHFRNDIHLTQRHIKNTHSSIYFIRFYIIQWWRITLFLTWYCMHATETTKQKVYLVLILYICILIWTYIQRYFFTHANTKSRPKPIIHQFATISLYNHTFAVIFEPYLHLHKKILSRHSLKPTNAP